MKPVSQTRAWLLGGAILVAGVGLSAALYMASRSPAPQTGVPAETAVSPATPEQTASGAQPGFQPEASEPTALPEPEPEPELQPLPAAPAFDVVRVAEDGGALVAGSAMPGAAVVVQVDGTPVAETAADNAGQFVALFTLAPSDAVQVMTLEVELADGRSRLSEDRVVLAPRPEVALAMSEAAPEAAPEVVLNALAAVSPEPGSAPPTSTMLPTLPGAQASGHEAAAPVLEIGDRAIEDGDGAPLHAGAAREDAGRAPEAPVQSASENATDAAGEVVADTPLIAEAVEPDGLVEIAEAPEPAVASEPAEAPESAEATELSDAPEPATASVAASAAGDGEAPEPAEAPETTDPTQLAATADASDAADNSLPRGFVLRGSGAVELLDSPPQVMDNVVIDVIAYSAQGDVQISGRAAQPGMGGSVQIYLDNRPIATALAENGDWSSNLPAIDPGIYTLRVDEIDAGGQVVSRFETPFQREDPAVVQAAQAQSDAPPAADAPLSATGPSADPNVASDPADPVAETGQLASAGAAAERPAPVALITVQPGHSLWRISEGHYGAGARYVVIYNANRSQIRNPDLIYPGQVFVLPD